MMPLSQVIIALDLVLIIPPPDLILIVSSCVIISAIAAP